MFSSSPLVNVKLFEAESGVMLVGGVLHTVSCQALPNCAFIASLWSEADAVWLQPQETRGPKPGDAGYSGRGATQMVDMMAAEAWSSLAVGSRGSAKQIRHRTDR